MATQEELRLAARLVFHEIVSRGQMEGCLREKDRRAEAGDVRDLADLVFEKGLASRAELNSMQGVPLTETQPIPDYRFIRRIAEGGMAEVYLATYLPLKEEVALKIMKPELARNEHFRLRFLREAKLMMNLDHENIVKGFEIRRSEGYVFCAMEHVDGSTVEERIETDGPFGEDLAFHVTREVARAISYLDRRGVVHRDLKPGNILLTASGRVKLIDLGLAKLREGMTQDSGEGITVGTVEYLSPEQARGLPDVDIRSDIYSLGVSLFHMIVGEVPFKGETNAEVIAKQVLQTLNSPVLKSRQISAHCHYFIQKMMAKDRQDRFQHPDDVVREIDEKLAHAFDVATPLPDSPLRTPGKPPAPALPPGRTLSTRRGADRKAGDRKRSASRRGRRRGRRDGRGRRQR